MKQNDNEANISNKNKGTKGVNIQYAKNTGNKGKQLNPNQKPISLDHQLDEDAMADDFPWSQ